MVREATSPIAKYTDEAPPNMAQVFTRNGHPLNIWVSVQVPTRKTFIDLIEVNSRIPRKADVRGTGERFRFQRLAQSYV